MDNNGPVNATSGIYESELVSAKVGNIVRNHNVDEVDLLLLFYC